MQLTLGRLLVLGLVVGLFVGLLGGCSGDSGDHAVTPPDGTPKLKVPGFAKKKDAKP
jgi:hypothetical protein